KRVTFGMKYQSIAAGNPTGESEASIWNDQLDPQLERADYDSVDYTHAQAFFHDAGRKEQEDEAFIAQNRRELAEVLPWWSKIGSLGLFVLVGYGRAAWHALAIGVLVVALAWWRMYFGGFVPSDKHPDQGATFHPFPDGLWTGVDGGLARG